MSRELQPTKDPRERAVRLLDRVGLAQSGTDHGAEPVPVRTQLGFPVNGTSVGAGLSVAGSHVSSL